MTEQIITDVEVNKFEVHWEITVSWDEDEGGFVWSAYGYEYDAEDDSYFDCPRLEQTSDGYTFETRVLAKEDAEKTLSAISSARRQARSDELRKKTEVYRFTA